MDSIPKVIEEADSETLVEDRKKKRKKDRQTDVRNIKQRDEERNIEISKYI